MCINIITNYLSYKHKFLQREIFHHLGKISIFFTIKLQNNSISNCKSSVFHFFIEICAYFQIRFLSDDSISSIEEY